ncbi:dicarboxylate/amino acid:cation symporter [soil metagenome]
MRRIALHWQILGALLLAVLAGYFLGPWRMGPVAATDVFDFVGTLFLNALKMIVVPLVVASIVTSVASLGTTEGFARMGLKTIGFYVITTLLAVVLGLVLVNLIAPGTRGDGAALQLPADVSEQLKKAEGRGIGDIAQIFTRMVPTNVISAAAGGDLLGLIFFSLLFGFFANQLPENLRNPFVAFWRSIYETMLLLTNFIMKFAPIGVFGLVANVVATTGFEAFERLGLFFATTAAALIIHTFVTLPLIIVLVARLDPRRHFRAMAPAMLTAFSTASSSATLPLTMECVEQRAGVSNRVASFTLPLGATVNMNGTALYECVAAMFIAQVYGVEFGFVTQFTVVLLALLTSIGVAGIPAASLVAIVIILNAVGLPAEGIGLILAVDRILDMMRTSVNIFGDSCAAIVIAKSEGEKDLLPAEPLVR